MLETLVQTLKFNFVKCAARPLANMLITYFSCMVPPLLLVRPVVIPIPLHAARERARGFNQSALIAECFARHFGFEYAPNAIMRAKVTLPQSTLNAGARRVNIKSSFAPARGAELTYHLRDRSVILIDDVVTSGATLREAASVLPAHSAGPLHHLHRSSYTSHPGHVSTPLLALAALKA